MKKPHDNSWKLISFFLAVSLILASAGCSRETPSVTTPTPPPQVVEEEEAVITFGGYEYQRSLFEPLMEAFHEQNPDITVQFVDVSQTFPPDMEWNQETYLRNLAQAADTVMLQGYYNMDLSRYFRNLQPLFESDPTFDQDDFWSGILTACEDGYGNTIGLPFTASINGIFYDAAAFDAVSAPYPKPGWTWDDFQKAVAATADKQGGDIKYGFYDQLDLGISVLAPVVRQHLRSNGGEVDAAALLEEVRWYVDLAQSGMLSGLKTGEEMENEWEKRARLFESEALRPAMWADSLISYLPSSRGPMFNENNPFSGTALAEFGFAPFPVSADGSLTQTSPSWVECAAVSAGSLNPRAAWTWLNFLSRHWLVVDKTQVYEIARAPARKSVANSVGYWDMLPAEAGPSVRFALEHGSYDFSNMELFYAIGLALAKTIADDTDFEQELATALAANPPTPTPPPVDNSPIVVATPRPPLPEGTTAIKYYISAYGPNEINSMKTLIEQYNQRSTDIQIQLFTDFMGNPSEDWLSSMAGKFDCFTSNPPYWEGLDAARLLNLNSLLSNEPASFANDFSPELLDKFRQEGNLYALPASTQMQMMAYNADLLASRGLEIPANDWTFDDFIEMSEAVASASGSDPSYGFLYSPYDEFISLGKGVQWTDFTSDPPEANFDSPEILDHLRWITNLEEDRVLLDQERDWEKANAIMTSGQLAFWTAMMGEESSWFYGMGQEPTFKIGVAPVPKTAAVNPMNTWSNDRGHYISAQAQDPQACWDWIKFMSEQPTLFSGLPARLSIAQSPAWESSVGTENAAAYRAALANLQPMDQVDSEKIQVFWPLYDWRSQTIRAALEGQDLQELLVDQQQKADDYIDCAVGLDTSAPPEELNQEMQACLKQADPEGNW